MGYLRKSISEIHEALINGLVTPEELVREALNKAHKDSNNAFEFICDEYAYSKLKELDSKDKNNMLWGIPFVIKDNFSTKDIPTCASSNILEGYKPIFSAEVVNKLEEKGAILIGKTTLDEFGMGGHGMSGHKGYVFNPWDPSHKREIGGSSSGSAAAVASGIVPYSIGTDTGDSVRRPAAQACLVGFKPTWGRISRYGVFPFAESLDHVAFFTRNVKDSAIVLENIAGHDEKDATSTWDFAKNYQKCINENLAGKRLAILKEIYDCFPDNFVKQGFNQLIEKMKNAGAIVEEVGFDKKLCSAILPTYLVISSAAATSNLACLDGIKYGAKETDDNYEDFVIQTRTKGFSNQIKRRLIFGSLALDENNYEKIYVKALKIRHLIADRANEILKDFDGIILPALSDIAQEFDNPQIVTDDLEIANNYMAISNFAGLPSITVPIGFSEGLSYGANISCKVFDEQTALDIAAGIENITGIKDLSVK